LLYGSVIAKRNQKKGFPIDSSTRRVADRNVGYCPCLF
jgi:hypothetical protein